jgi:hypothetical protein
MTAPRFIRTPRVTGRAVRMFCVCGAGASARSEDVRRGFYGVITEFAQVAQKVDG